VEPLVGVFGAGMATVGASDGIAFGTICWTFGGVTGAVGTGGGDEVSIGLAAAVGALGVEAPVDFRTDLMGSAMNVFETFE
jgi:hypothetical protein